MENNHYDVIVIGAGSAGLTAAISSAIIGAKVLLVEKDKIGGDCTHYGCVPSKALIKAGKIARILRDVGRYGVSSHKNSTEAFSIEVALKKAQAVIRRVEEGESTEVLAGYGIEVVIGEARFIDSHTISVDQSPYVGKRIIIATGSNPIIPTIKGLESVDYLTNKSIFTPREMESLAIIGAGPIGCELAQAFNNLGVRVHLINNSEFILGREDPEAAQLLQTIFLEDGISVYPNSETLSVSSSGSKKIVQIKHTINNTEHAIEAGHLLVAVGRAPTVSGLDLEKAGVAYDEKGIKVNKHGRTSISHIYAIGDAIGAPFFTHLANHHGKIASRNALLKFMPSRYEKTVIPRVTFTMPEIASVGINSVETSDDVIVIKKDLKCVDKAIADSEEVGFYKLFVDNKGYILGAVLVGGEAGELIGEIALAMKHDITIDKLAKTIHPYPTYSFGLQQLAEQFGIKRYTTQKKHLVQKIYRLNRL